MITPAGNSRTGQLDGDGGSAPAVSLVSPLDDDHRQLRIDVDARQAAGEGLFPRVVVGQLAHTDLSTVLGHHPPRVGIAIRGVVGRAHGDGERPGAIDIEGGFGRDDVGKETIAHGRGTAGGVAIIGAAADNDEDGDKDQTDNGSHDPILARRRGR